MSRRVHFEPYIDPTGDEEIIWDEGQHPMNIFPERHIVRQQEYEYRPPLFSGEQLKKIFPPKPTNTIVDKSFMDWELAGLGLKRKSTNLEQAYNSKGEKVSVPSLYREENYQLHSPTYIDINWDAEYPPRNINDMIRESNENPRKVIMSELCREVAWKNVFKVQGRYDFSKMNAWMNNNLNFTERRKFEQIEDDGFSWIARQVQFWEFRLKSESLTKLLT